MALEGAPLGIRVNVVNPDAVLRGSKIWQGDWRKSARQIATRSREDELEEHLPQALAAAAHGLPEDIAEGGLFLRLRPVGEVDRQYPQRRCRQRHIASRGSADDLPHPRRSDRRAEPQARSRRSPKTTRPRRASSRGAASTSRRYQARHGLRRGGADLGRGHRRHALCPLSRARRAAQHPREARGLRRHPAAVAGHAHGHRRISRGTRSPTTARCAQAAPPGSRLRRGQLQHLPGPAGPEAQLQVRLAQPHRCGACAQQAVEHNIECIEIGRQLGSTALTVWIADGCEFRRPAAISPPPSTAISTACGNLCRPARRLAGVPRAQALRARLLFDGDRRLGLKPDWRRPSSGRRPSAWSISATMRRTPTSSRSSPG